MPLPTPLDLKKFYILLALAEGPLHGYAIRQQVVHDSSQSLYLSFTTLYRLLESLSKQKLIEGSYQLTLKGRRRLRLEATDLAAATKKALSSSSTITML